MKSCYLPTPKPGKFQTKWINDRKLRVQIVLAEIRVAPKKLLHARFSVKIHGEERAIQLANAWLDEKRLEQTKNYELAREELKLQVEREWRERVRKALSEAGSGPVRLPLGHGRFALIDAPDFELVGRHKWQLISTRGHEPYYAQRTFRVGRGKGAISLHRSLMCPGPGQYVDHINGDGLDNRRSNLRLTDRSGNARNMHRTKNRLRGGFKGVHWSKKKGAWFAKIAAGKKLPSGKSSSVALGRFSDPEAAARAYDAAARKYFGEFANCNFPETGT